MFVKNFRKDTIKIPNDQTLSASRCGRAFPEAKKWFPDAGSHFLRLKNGFLIWESIF